MTGARRIGMAYNNLYLIEGGEATVLIDTGPDYRGAREQLERELTRLPDLVIATHAHQDHAGLGAWWQERGVAVAMGVADIAQARAPHFRDEGEFEAMRQWLEVSGAPPAVVAAAEAGLERRRAWMREQALPGTYPEGGRHWPTGLRYEPFEPRLAVGEEVALHGLRLLQCPGHTPGNLVVVHEEQGWLFSGDQLLPDITPTPGVQFRREAGAWVRFRSLPAFAASLRRLEGMAFRRCFPGHGEPFANVAETIAANLAAIEARDERTLDELRAGGPMRVYALAERLYPRALRRRFWQIAATVQGHLDSLEAAGFVRVDAGVYELR